MREFLAAELNRLKRRSKKGNFQPGVLGMAASVTHFPIDDLAHLADDFRQESKGLARQIENLTKVLEDSNQYNLRDRPINCTVTVQGVEMNSGDNFTFNDRAAGVFGRGNTANGNTFIAGDSVTSPSVELNCLLEAIAALRPQLEPSVSSDLEVAAVEVVQSEEPERVKTALQKIAGIAAMAGSAGVAVIEAVKSVSTALAIGQ
ncbi:hypothetical protein GCM10009555_001790 [Acrocarpospora macrocephala]|uniref:Uncharacterized protein n=2 Tax=Acrocarpospora macrocephala TaxID=150177 RepID=A0A5M3X6A2_9ACTN|nr:hypothetical protein Amac_102180 [Acrocarpospora macrocephala]